MEWIKVTKQLPNPFEVVWIYWRDREVILGCRIYQGNEAIKCDASEGWYSFEDYKCKWTHWWQRVSANNLDRPYAPKE